jgi:hypothetical protein
MDIISREYLQRLMQGGESETVEFKRRLPPSSIVARHLAAFANTSGGTLIIGVDDRGYSRGLTRAEMEQALEVVSNVASSMFSWPVSVQALRQQDDTYVVYAVTPKAPDAAAPVLTASGELFQRKGKNLIKLSREEEFRALTHGASPPLTRHWRCVVFVAMSFREDEEPALVDYFRAMERAAKRTQLPVELTRMDLIEGDYDIAQRLMQEIDRAHIVIADFTLSARNVYFELGYARGKGKRVIQTARQNEKLEFDIRNTRTIFYRNATELEEKLVAELQAAYGELSEIVRYDTTGA